MENWGSNRISCMQQNYWVVKLESELNQWNCHPTLLSLMLRIALEFSYFGCLQVILEYFYDVYVRISHSWVFRQWPEHQSPWGISFRSELKGLECKGTYLILVSKFHSVFIYCSLDLVSLYFICSFICLIYVD